MSYCIARRNKETGKFEIESDNQHNDVITYDQSDAKAYYCNAVKAVGTENVCLLKRCFPLVQTTVTMEEEVTKV